MSGLTIAEYFGLKPGSIAMRWPSTHGARLASSTYDLSLSATDEAGNTGTSSPRIRPLHEAPMVSPGASRAA